MDNISECIEFHRNGVSLTKSEYRYEFIVDFGGTIVRGWAVVQVVFSVQYSLKSSAIFFRKCHSTHNYSEIMLNYYRMGTNRSP